MQLSQLFQLIMILKACQEKKKKSDSLSVTFDVDYDASTTCCWSSCHQVIMVSIGCALCCAMTAGDWCISIFTVFVKDWIIVICFLTRRFFVCALLRYRSAVHVVLFDRTHPSSSWNFNSIIPIDIVRVKSYVNCLSNHSGALMRVARSTLPRTNQPVCYLLCTRPIDTFA